MVENQAERLMRRAIELSQMGFPAPNPHVGCVLAKGSEVVGEGFHDHAGGPHAEVVAIEQARNEARGATAYVTLEPCNHVGKTGPCSHALIQAGISKVVFAVVNPNPRASGGAAALRDAGIEVSSGLCREEAERANEAFLTSMRLGRPYVCLKAACSLDGFMALPDGTSKWITGPEARKQGHWLRAQMGAVLVGANTVIADDPRLTARISGVVNQPIRIILDPDGRVRPNARVFNEPGSVLHFVAKPSAAQQIVLPLVNGEFGLDEVLAELWRRNITSLLVEGGPATLGGFLRRSRFDRLDLFVAPKLLGHGLSFSAGLRTSSIEDCLALHLRKEKVLGNDVWLTYAPA